MPNPEEGRPVNWQRWVNDATELSKNSMSKWEKYAEMYGGKPHDKYEEKLKRIVRAVGEGEFPSYTDTIGRNVVLKHNAPVTGEILSLHGFVSNWNGRTNELEVTFDNGYVAEFPSDWLAEDASRKKSTVINTKCVLCFNVMGGKAVRIKGEGTKPYYICSPCHDTAYFRCTHCSRHCKTKNHPNVDPELNKKICTACFRARYFECNNCHKPCNRGEGSGGRCSKCMYERVVQRAFTANAFTHTLGIKRFYGVEVECFCPDESSVRMEGWEVGGDGSIHCPGDSIGVEYRSGIFQGDRGIGLLNELCTKMARKDHDVNRSCGLHVHVDCTDLTQDQIINVASFIRVFDNIIYSLMPRSRSKNDYCQKFNLPIRRLKESKLAKMNKLTHFDNMGRYRGFNVSAYHEHGTIEFRYHNGTINFQKIKNWIQTCLLIVDKQKDNFWDERTRSLKPCRRNLTKFFRYLDMPQELQDYWIARYTQFNGKRKKKVKEEKVVRTTQHRGNINAGVPTPNPYDSLTGELRPSATRPNRALGTSDIEAYRLYVAHINAEQELQELKQEIVRQYDRHALTYPAAVGILGVIEERIVAIRGRR